ncbi:hypothetical protein GA0070606_3735 [Micromonospora citrea]|uniref:FG-GAP repeat-containing protein n=1 Tax=Micromonospora citrea TaxID=47855 RepID=A0A1C6V9Q5_9ACTN|nr:hypothetical protein [Micromonospora citrea]SCL63083.1 hypothetical protein GA0070606_3735 [Micromonospora citrea]
MRRKLVPVVALSMACLLVFTSACSSGSRKKRNRSADRPATSAKDIDGDATRATPTPRRTARPADRLTCADLRSAEVGSRQVRFRGYADPIPLAGGRWAGGDGSTVELQKPCAIGDLDGDGADDAVGVVMLNGGGSGSFFTLAVWRNVGGDPAYQAQTDLGDRTPVTSVSVRDGRATVVYLTRTPDSAMAELNIRRTASYQLSGTSLTERGHTDAPYRS